MDRQLFDVLSGIAHSPDPVERIRMIIRAAVGFFDKFPYFLELLPSIDAKIPNGEFPRFSSRKEQFHTIIREALDDLTRAEGVAVADADFSAISLIALINEVLRATPRPWPESLIEQIERQFLYGVRGVPC